MKIHIGKDPANMCIHRVALIHYQGSTMIFGAHTDEKEINDLRTRIPRIVAFNETDRKWWIRNDGSQANYIGDFVACWVAYFEGKPDTVFFIPEEYGLGTKSNDFTPSDGRVGIYDITTPDNVLLFEHGTHEKLEELLRACYPAKFADAPPNFRDEVTWTTIDGLTGPKGAGYPGVEQFPNDPNPLGEDHHPSEPEEIEPEFDELPRLTLNDLDLQMQEAILDMSMVSTEQDHLNDDIQMATQLNEMMALQDEFISRVKAAYPDQFVEFVTLVQLIKRYREMLRVDRSSHMDITVDHYGPFTSISHLHHMLNILETDLAQSITKKHRWLGYIQGLLVVYGFTSVTRERNYTRDIFNGQ